MLTQALGYNNPKVKKLTELYKDIGAFFAAGENEWRLCGIFTVRDMEKLEKMNRRNADRVIDRCVQFGYSVLTIDDPAYPDCLYNIYAPPAVLYVKGVLPDLDSLLSVGIVGTRSASRFGVENSYKIAYALSKCDTIIVSGGALGVDCASHRGALAAGGVTVCVLGCGINSRYLRENEKMRDAITGKGAVISEYPPDTEPRGFHFPARNRIIAALSDGVLIIEAGERSGSLITADFALEMGKDVFALMGNNGPKTEGSNGRIKEGSAVPITDFMDILAYYSRADDSSGGDKVELEDIIFSDIEAVPVKKGENTAAKKNDKAFAKPQKKSDAVANKDNKKNTDTPKPKHRNDVNLKGDAGIIYDYLSAEPVHIDTIADDLGLSVGRVLGILTLLEVQGLVLALQGRNYVLK